MNTFFNTIIKDSRRHSDNFLKAFLSISFQYVLWFRICHQLSLHKILKPIFYCAKFIYVILWHIRGISIPHNCNIGDGFLIVHFSDITIANHVTIGKNCTIFQDVTIGRNFGEQNNGSPTIGDNVFIFPGAKVIGKIKIGNNVVIGANAVVTKDIPDNSVVAGIPAKIISNDIYKAVSKYNRKHFFHSLDLD